MISGHNKFEVLGLHVIGNNFQVGQPVEIFVRIQDPNFNDVRLRRDGFVAKVDKSEVSTPALPMSRLTLQLNAVFLEDK